MEGVIILNTFIEKLAVIQPWCTIGMSLIIGGMIGLIVFASISNYSGRIWSVLATILCAICCVVGFCIGAFAPRETETRYQVIIDDTVNFNEFYTHYEVIKADGQIYTVRLLDK